MELFLKSVRRELLKTSEVEVAYEQEEYGALNWHCVLGGGSSALLRTPTTLLVTHFREPISRINSEYWFKGPGDQLDVANESLWKTWMNETRPGVGSVAPAFTRGHGTNYNAGLYFDNYYVRMLSAECGTMVPRGADAGLPRLDQLRSRMAARANKNKPQLPGSGACTRSAPHVGKAATKSFPSVQGCAAHSGQWPFRAVNEADFQKAREVLAVFDIIIIFERAYTLSIF